MERSVTLDPLRAELVVRFATQAIRDGELDRLEEAAARDLRDSVIQANTTHTLTSRTQDT
jgi:hypothetical protein